MGGRDHTTVIHGIRATERRMAQDAEFLDKVADIMTEIRFQSKPHFYRHGFFDFVSVRRRSEGGE